MCPRIITVSLQFCTLRYLVIQQYGYQMLLHFKDMSLVRALDSSIEHCGNLILQNAAGPQLPIELTVQLWNVTFLFQLYKPLASCWLLPFLSSIIPTFNKMMVSRQVVGRLFFRSHERNVQILYSLILCKW